MTLCNKGVIIMWKTVKFKGEYKNIYVQENEDTVLVMYPPDYPELIAKHQLIMEKKGYHVALINKNTYTYEKQ